MPIRHGLLALLAEGPGHGFRLRAEFEQRTGGTWPLNIGQVYTTLSRLVRDGLVEELSRETDGSVRYGVTPAGLAELERWWGDPVDRRVPARDELAIKLALAVASPGVDVAAVIQRQRAETLRRLQEYTAHKREQGAAADREALAGGLVLDHLIFVAEAEARWLDHVETAVRRHAATITKGQSRS